MTTDRLKASDLKKPTQHVDKVIVVSDDGRWFELDIYINGTYRNTVKRWKRIRYARRQA